jgi:hypothetical protein
LPLPVFIFRVFSPEIACQVPKPPNPLSNNDIHGYKYIWLTQSGRKSGKSG